MPGQKVRYRTKRERALRRNLVRAGVWVFLAFFVVSVVGVVVTLQR
jgi:hypothetical protein